jgi:hypothetical protein
MRVLVGRTQLTPSFKPPPGRTNGQIRGVSDIAISNNWNNPKSPSSLNDYTWDVAVLKLSSPVTGITPVRIPTEADNSYQKPGKSLMRVAGWGYTRAEGTTSNNLLEAEVPIVSDADAANLVQPYPFPKTT